jgi:transposase InsO family protein
MSVCRVRRGGAMDIVKARLGWIQLYEETNDAGLVCRRCGISRPTLRKWQRRFQADGEAGLSDQSRRPLSSPGQKIFVEQEALILTLRRDRKLGVKQLRNELIRHHDLPLSLDTIHRVLVRHNVQILKRPRRRLKGALRYSRPLPGDRIQMDVCKIAPGVYQYTAIDDCSRYKVVGVYGRRTAANTLAFLDRVIEEMPFPIERIQTDRGLEFFAEEVQRLLMEWAIKFRPIAPRSPHLNGKVERTQRTDLEEFWSAVHPKDAEIETRLSEWQHHWNWERPHTALGGATPIERICELLEKIPLTEEIEARYDASREHIRLADSRLDAALNALK